MPMKKLILPILSLLLLLSIADARIWTNKKGQSFEGAFVESKDNTIVISRAPDGLNFTVPIKDLSDEDQKYLKDLLETTIAFPGAEGYGRFAKGGLGGDVYIVSNLNDDGEGSLRYGIEKMKSPRTIVFAVSGTIELKEPLVIGDSYLTIAGQTAPGDGICLKDHGVEVKGKDDEDIHDIIIRYIRVRLGDKNKGDESSAECFKVKYCSDIIFDHISAGWGIDSCQDTDAVKNYTLQWSIYGETLHNSIHHSGKAHSKLMSFRKCVGNISLHHNLLHSTKDRHPSLGGGVADAILDMRNNIVYNAGGGAQTNLGSSQNHVINNYYKEGPDSKTGLWPMRVKTKTVGEEYNKGFVSGNIFSWSSEWTNDNYTAIEYIQEDDKYLSIPREDWELPISLVFGDDKPATTSAEEAMDVILENAGASKSRDACDERIINGGERVLEEFLTLRMKWVDGLH